MENRKIVIIGAGHVGSHCAYALAASGICEEIVLVDLIKEKAEAQALDVADSVSFMDHAVSVRAGSCSECRDAALTVVAIGEPRLPGQTRLDLLGRSVELLSVLANELKPLSLTCPVVTIVSQATFDSGSKANNSSRMASEIWSATLSGCPSDTDSEVNK